MMDAPLIDRPDLIQGAGRQDAGAAYRPETPWRAWSAFVAAIGISSAAVAAAVLVGQGLMPRLVDYPGMARWLPMVAFQGVVILGAIWLAGWFGGARGRVLALDGRWPRLADMALLLAVFLIFALPYTYAIYQFRPDVLVSDNYLFSQMMRSDAWLIFGLIIALGAPLSEELLFRGFLLPALAKSRIGFAGAALVSTLLWTGLHYTYSIFGLVEIFVIGLILSWALHRTGSLWAPIIIHAVNNGALAIAMRLQLFPWM
jgi:uncharacterized protein